MPEIYDNVKSSLLNDSDEDQNENVDDGTTNSKKYDSSVFGIIVRNFFNNQKTFKTAANAEVNNQQNKCTGQLSDPLPENVAEKSYEAVDGESSNESSPVRHKSGTNEGFIKRCLHKYGKNEDKKLLVKKNGLEKLKCRSSGDSKKSKFSFFKICRKRTKSTAHSDETDTSSVYEAVPVSRNVSQESFEDSPGLVREQFKRSDRSLSESEYEIQESPGHHKDEPREGTSRNCLRRSFSTQNKKQIPKETKSQSKNFCKFSFGNLILPRLYSGSAILKNKGNANVKFTELKSDSEVIVDSTETYRSMSNPSLLSGGQVVFEGFADSFTPLTFEADNPLVFDKFPEGVTIPEFSTFKPLSSESRAARLVSGGSMTDSSKCASLPELFPLKKASSLDVHRPSTSRHLSGGEMVESRESEMEISVDLFSKNVQISQNSVTSNFDIQESPNSFPRSFSIDFFPVKQSNVKCPCGSNTNPFASTSSLSNYNPTHASCNCNRDSGNCSSALASSEYLETDFEVNVNTQHTRISEKYTEDLSEKDFLNSTIPRSFSQYSLNQEIIPESDRSETVRNENPNPSSEAKVSKFHKDPSEVL